MPPITIQTLTGPVDVVADVIGVWAIHRMIGGGRDGYQVTHIGSGFGFLKADKDGIPYDKAKELVAAIDATGLDWTLPNGLDGVTKAHAEAGKRLRTQFNPKADE